VGGSAEPEDDGERAVGTVAEVLLECRPDALRVGARDVERVREEGREPAARETPGEEDRDPEHQDQQTVAQHESRPDSHASTLPRGVPFRDSWAAGTSATCTR